MNTVSDVTKPTEMQVIQGLIDLASGQAKTIDGLIKSVELLKERVEALEAKNVKG